MPYDGVWAEGKTPLLTSEPIINGLKLFKQMYDVAMPQGADGATGQRLFGTGAVAQGLFVSAAVGGFKPIVPGSLSAAAQRAHPVGQQQVDRPHPPDDDQQGISRSRTRRSSL